MNSGEKMLNERHFCSPLRDTIFDEDYIDREIVDYIGFLSADE